MSILGACIAGWVALLVAMGSLRPVVGGRDGAGRGPRSGRTRRTGRAGRTGRAVGPRSIALRSLAPRTAGRAARRIVRRGRDERRERELLAAVAMVSDLLRVSMSVGATARGAVELVARHGGPLGCGLDAVVVAVRAGDPFDAAVEEWAERTGGPADELASALVAAERRGVAIAASLGRLADDLRRRRRRSAEAAARRLTVRILMPLVCCILPAFGLLVVAPMIVTGLARIAAP